MRGKHRRQWYLLLMNPVAEPDMVCDWMNLEELPDNYFFPCVIVRYALLMQTAELLTRDGKRLLTGMKESRLQGRQEMRGKHRDMWQFIIDKVDDILIDYFIDPEDILIEYKRVYIYHADPGADIKFNCYACEKFFDNGCNNCIIGKKIGCCSYDDSAFQSFLAAIRNRDRKEFIRQARRIKNAWN